MRTIVKLAGIAAAFVLAACNGADSAMNADLKKDLERASTASEITLPTSQPASQVVSAIERTTPPALRRVAQSQRVPKHRAAPRALPAPVQTETPDVSSEVAPQPVVTSPTPTEVAPLPSPRPQPVASSGIGAGDGRAGSGRGDQGIGIGTIIGVVLRGGVVDGDDCDPRTDGRRGGVTAVNNRIPVIGTFPGSGRIGTAATIGGMVFGGGGRRRF